MMNYYRVSFLLLGLFSFNAAQNCPENLTSSTQYVSDPTDCRNYWICNHKVQKKMRCPANQCFNPEINECSYKDDCTQGTFFPDCSNCTKYYECSNGNQIHMTCPENLWFNFVEERCDYIRNYPVLHGCGDIRCTEGPDRKKYKVDNDKRKFIWCISGMAYLYACECKDYERCYFDYENQKCWINAQPQLNNFIMKESSINNFENSSIPNICRRAPLLDN
ncbi:peritrophin-1-like isoform X2 [Coccinella septempunctata]|uniref:peritrophin-1-like isoform X2 n=1 Tax=Coccinella septempunctata TaxID=41139 RepID=UPI001D069F65|nr:peritrophin-1-like isoform X2 [Coccinella septempunctata]